MPEIAQSTERSSRRRSHDRSPVKKWVKGLETLGGTLICILAALTPWLFGTTESWSIRLMNIGSYGAGGILAVAAILNRVQRAELTTPNPAERFPKFAFLALNILLLGYCTVAWWNARASFLERDESFTYHEYIKWLPTTYDDRLTKEMLLMLGACFAVFWGARYWLVRGWENTLKRRPEPHLATALSNRRFTAILWVLSLNGLAMSLEGILQRLSGTLKLLWLRESYWSDAHTSFGPFSYRGNAADYLNLIWPVALAFWWAMNTQRRCTARSSRLITDGPEMILLPAVVIMTAASFMTLSRGGAIIAAAILLAVCVIFVVQKGLSRMTVIGAALLILALAALVNLQWDGLVGRFKDGNLTNVSARMEIYRNARQMAADYPVFGTGPGSFRSIYHLYREDTNQTRHGFVHDDWLETLVTFGWVGFSLVLAQLVVLVLWVLARGKAPVSGVFAMLFALALGGCLAHAKFDFPFQTYSIFYTFVVLCAVFTTVTSAHR